MVNNIYKQETNTEGWVVINFTCPISLRTKLREYSKAVNKPMAVIIRNGLEKEII